MTQEYDSPEAEHMFEILDFARCHGRKISKEQLRTFDKGAQSTLQKLIIGEYLKKVEKDGNFFFSLNSRGLNLFGAVRKDQPVPEELKAQIVDNLEKVMADVRVKPWEVMFHIIHVIGKEKPVTTQDIIDYFSEHFPDIKGASRPNIYRNIKHLRMKRYIEYEKMTHLGQSEYKLSKKGEEIFFMTQADATSKLRTSEEWDRTLRQVFQNVDEEKKEDDEALFYTLDSALPALDNQQMVWVLYTQGNIYELKNSLDRAEEVYLRMEGICEEVKDDRGRAYAQKGLGNVAFKKNRCSVAKQYYTRCLKIAQEVQDSQLLSDVFNNLGACLYVDDDVDEALQVFEKALDIAGDDSRRASTLYNIGLCHARKEDLDKAKEFWLKSLHLYKELEENIESEKVQHNLREIDRKQKREYLLEKYRKAMQMGTTEDIEKAYKDLVVFMRDGFTNERRKTYVPG
jgi:tetratricopeptide (TPR) repeat protein